MRVLRFDQMPLTATRDANGFLAAPATFTRAGVFYYMDANGSVRAEFRPEEEVFANETLESLRMLPVTLDHPPEMINPSNAKQYTVGFSSEQVLRKADLATGYIKITDENAIGAVENGDAQELSCGYTADLEVVEGIWNGIKYDGIQRNIRYNHVAIVERGRAGAQCRIKTDSADVRINSCEPVNNRRMDSMKIIKLDGIDFELPENSYQAVAKELARRDASEEEMKKKIDEYKKKIKDIEAEMEKGKGKEDALTAETAKLKEELEAARKDANDLERIQKLVASRAELISKAQPFVGEVKLDTLSDLDIKKAVVVAAYPEVKTDELSAERVDGMFEGAVMFASKVVANQAKADSSVKGAVGAPAKNVYEQVRERELNRYKATLEKK